MARRGAPGRLAALRSSVALTRQGKAFLVAAVVLGVAAHVFALSTLTSVACLLAALVVAAAVLVVVAQTRLRVDRSFEPEVVESGHASTATVHVTNLAPWPTLEARWADSLPTGLTGDATGTLPGLGSARSTDARAHLDYVVQGARRGRHHVGPLLVESSDPFGLVVRRRRIGGPRSVVVLPRRVALPALVVAGTSDDGASRPAPQHAGLGEDDVIARPYTSGDAMKRLHWKATAHRGELMVRQEEQQINPQATVLLDLDAAGLGTARDRQGDWEYSPALEWGLVAAASALEHLVRSGFVVTLTTPGGAPDRVVAEGMDTVRDALVDLAVAEPVTVPVSAIPAGAPTGRLTVAVLGRLDLQRATAWAGCAGATALAFVAAGTPSECLEALERRGWRCVTYRASDDLVTAWTRFDPRLADAAR